MKQPIAITRTANLVLRFKEYGSLVSERWPTRLDLRMPFFYLRTQGFWQGFTLQMTPAQSPESCFVCELNEEFFDLLGDADFRLKARLLLVSRYFEPRERVALLESLGLCADGLQKAERRMCELNEEGEEAARRKGRSARFAVQVVSRYKFTCALTGLSCLTTDGAAIVDAAHIESWAASENDDIQNGLALCKNAHWREGLDEAPAARRRRSVLLNPSLLIRTGLRCTYRLKPRPHSCASTITALKRPWNRCPHRPWRRLNHML